MDFSLTESPLKDLDPLAVPSSCGARAIFCGHVRDHHEGRPVASLEYHAYPELALKEGTRILAEATEKFGLEAGRIVHRLGHLQIGEEAVRVEVATAHRGEAFEACRWIIDEVKHRVPIWKKEFYRDGSHDWVACHRCADPR